MEQKLTTRKIVLMTDDLAAQLDEYRFAHRFKSEAEAIRALIRAGLKAAQTDK